MVISGIGIQEVEECEFGGGVDELVDLEERKTVLGAGFIEIREVHAHSPFLGGFLRHYHVGHPSRVIHFADEADLR